MGKIIMEADYGESIQDYAKRVISRFESVAKTNNSTDFEIDCGEFNGVRLRCTKDTTEESFINSFRMQMEENQKAYLESEEYKEKLRRDKIEIDAMNKKASAMERELQLMDFSKKRDLLLWLKEYQPLTDRVGVSTNTMMVVDILEQKGFYEDMNIKENFIEDDADNVAGYIVGQCISGMNMVGAIHSVVGKFVDDWITKFDNL